MVGTGIGARQEAMRGRTAGVMTNTVGSPARMGRETIPPLMLEVSGRKMKTIPVKKGRGWKAG